MLKTVKLSRKTGIAIAVIGLLCVGGIANSVKNIKFESLKSVVDLSVAPIQEFSGIAFNENALLELGQFEYQFGLGEFYSNNHQYEKALACYSNAILCAKESLGAKSFFTALAYFRKGQVEEDNSKFDEAHDDFKATLKALPNRPEYDVPRCSTESSLISTAEDKTKRENIPFYRQHLALTEKLANTYPNLHQHIYALWVLGRALDDDEQYAESEPIWNKMIGEVRLANYSSRKFESYLLDYAYHEMCTARYTQSETALAQAAKIASQTGNDEMVAAVLESQGDLQLRRNNLVEAENKFQASLTIRKKLKDRAALCYAYACLAGVARRRSDLAKREDYETMVSNLTVKPSEKANSLWYLACIAAQRNGAPRVKKYVEERSRLVEKNSQQEPFIFEQDMKNLLILYPRLKRTDKSVSRSPKTNIDFDNLRLEHVGFDQSGYYLSPQQARRLIDVISL